MSKWVTDILQILPATLADYHKLAEYHYRTEPIKPVTNIYKINAKIRYLARLIVDPRFQKLGLATWLLKDTLERQHIPIVETLTPIDFTNKMFEKAGFKLYQTPAPPWYNRFTFALESLGLTEQSRVSPLYIHNRLGRLAGTQKTLIENEIKHFIKHFRHRENMPDSMERTKFFLSKLPYPQAYLIWFNPRVPFLPENRGDSL